MSLLGLSFESLVALWRNNPGAVAYLTAAHGGKQLCAALGASLGPEYVEALCRQLDLLQASAECKHAA